MIAAEWSCLLWKAASGSLAPAMGGRGQVTAEIGQLRKALAKCHSDSTRTEDTLPCFLYAVDNQVILPQRLEEARPDNSVQQKNDK